MIFKRKIWSINPDDGYKVTKISNLIFTLLIYKITRFKRKTR